MQLRGDPPMEGALFEYRTKTSTDKRSSYYYKDLYSVMIRLKVLMDDFQAGFLRQIMKKDFRPLDNHRDDWLREALMSCFELGIGITPQNALRLMEDRSYFESLLPIPIDSTEWGGASGTEVMRQWWTLAPESYRKHQLETFKSNLNSIDENELKRALACHPSSGNRNSGYMEKFFRIWNESKSAQ